VQAIAGILSGLQSMHTDAYDEAITCPTEEAARIAVATQNILREEAHLCDVIDPLGGSYYVERLTGEMESQIEAVIARIDEAGGMYRAVESGLVQRMIGKSARVFQEKIESEEQRVVGVNCYRDEAEARPEPLPYRPDRVEMAAHVEELRAFKASRSQEDVRRALDALSRAARDESRNVFAEVIRAAEAGVTHGEIVQRLRDEIGFGHPLIVE
jgi:methylmalonyl-CoA mutase N-terminal domain/subunit